MRKSTKAAQDAATAAESAATTADATLKEIQRGGTDTRDLAVAAGKQAGAAMAMIDLQKQIARAAHGKPIVTPSNIGVFRETEKVWTQVYVRNSGLQDADGLKVAVRVDFLSAPPRQSSRIFTDADFANTTPSKIQPVSKGGDDALAHRAERRISAKQYPAYEGPDVNMYIWGEIRYTDFTGIRDSMTFCRYAPAKDVLGAKSYSNFSPSCD